MGYAEHVAMASERNSLGPELNRLNFPDASVAPLPLTRQELETLFTPLFDDTFETRAQNVSTDSAAQPVTTQCLIPLLLQLL